MTFESAETLNKHHFSKKGALPDQRVCMGFNIIKFDTKNNDYNISLMYSPYSFARGDAFRENITRS